MSQLVFQRVERKYLVDDRQYQALRLSLPEWMEADKYSDYMIHNLYYDTPDDYLIRTSLDKPVYKEKLRLRCYGEPSGSSPCFAELKKKYRGVVYKRRLELTLDQACRWLNRGEPLESPCQISREIDWFLAHYRPVPKVVLTYHRLACHGREDPELRLTFDDDVRWRSWDLDLTRPIDGYPLLAPGQRLMELKVPDAIPLWLVHLLNRLEIRPATFSKYGRAYQQLKQQELKGAIPSA